MQRAAPDRWRKGFAAAALLLLSYPALSEDVTARPGEHGVELTMPLQIGHKSVQGWVRPGDVPGMLDEPADNLQPLRLAPPGTSPPTAWARSRKQKKWFDTWAKVGTCREWMRLHAAGWYAFDTVDMASDGEFLAVCGTLYSISLGRAAKTSYLPRQGLGDLGLYSPVLLGDFADQPDERDGQHLAANDRSLNSLARDVTPPITIVSAAYSDDHYYYGHDLASDRQIVMVNHDKDMLKYFYSGVSNSLKLLARGNFTGGGSEEFLVFYSFNSGGTLTISKLLMLGRASETAPIAPVACVLAYKPCELDASLKPLPASPKP